MDKNNYPGKYQNQSFCSVAPWVPRVFPFFPSERMSFIKLCRFLTPEADRLGKNSVSVAVFSSNQDFSSWILITNCPPFLKEGKSFWVQKTRSVLLFFHLKSESRIILLWIWMIFFREEAEEAVYISAFTMPFGCQSCLCLEQCFLLHKLNTPMHRSQWITVRQWLSCKYQIVFWLKGAI